MAKGAATGLEGVAAEAARAGSLLAKTFRLSLRPPRNASAGGNWLGVGSGSSIDFQDHRPYLPGDDPRYINWQAYARTGSYSMKLYRDETSPLVDLVLDTSRSVLDAPAKSLTALTLFHLCREYAQGSGASLHCYRVGPGEHSRLTAEETLGSKWLRERLEVVSATLVPEFASIPWRTHSVRIVISDFLYPGDPAAIMGSYFRGSSWGVGLRVYSRDEETPDWQGGMKLYDTETNEEEIVYCDRALLRDYESSYQQHMELWAEQMRRFGCSLVSFSSDEGLRGQLAQRGVVSGVFTV